MNAQTVLTDIVTYGPWVITAAAAAMMALPQGAPGSTWDKIRTFVNFLALNFGHAKNEKEKP